MKNIKKLKIKLNKLYYRIKYNPSEFFKFYLTWRIKQYLKNIIYGNKTFMKKDIKKLLENYPNPVVLEIGANDGADTLEFLKIFKKIKMYSFEPDPRAIKQFKRNVHDPRCKLFKIAIGNKDGSTSFYQSESKSIEGWDDSSSIKKPKNHLKLNPDIKFDNKIKINIEKLDTWFSKQNLKFIDFIWADIQGAEKDLILGGMKTLEKTHYLYTEFSDGELYDGQPSLKEITQLLPNFELIGIYSGDNVLLRNKNFKRNK